MANYQDQARAIWDALDKMVEQDPEGYKRFVSEQLQEGRNQMKKENPAEISSQQPSKKQQGQGKPIKELEKLFGKMALFPGSQQSQVDGPSTLPDKNRQKGALRKDLDAKNNVQEIVRASEGGSSNSNASSGGLLDDEIGGKRSILAQIVKDSSKYDDEEEDEGNVTLSTLEIQGATKNNGSGEKMKKRLIEEI